MSVPRLQVWPGPGQLQLRRGHFVYLSIDKVPPSLSVVKRTIADVAEPFPDLMGAAEVARLLGLSRQRVNQLARAGALPEPVAVLDAGRIWLAADIRTWKSEREAK